MINNDNETPSLTMRLVHYLLARILEVMFISLLLAPYLYFIGDKETSISDAFSWAFLISLTFMILWFYWLPTLLVSVIAGLRRRFFSPKNMLFLYIAHVVFILLLIVVFTNLVLGEGNIPPIIFKIVPYVVGFLGVALSQLTCAKIFSDFWD